MKTSKRVYTETEYFGDLMEIQNFEVTSFSEIDNEIRVMVQNRLTKVYLFIVKVQDENPWAERFARIIKDLYLSTLEKDYMVHKE